MAFRGVTFSAQNVTPKDDGALYNAHYGDGILNGCAMAISGDDLVIQPGHFIACGRGCQVDGATSVDLSGRTLQTGYIQVLMNYDLTQGEGQQWYTTFVESATTTFPALTKDDINTPTGELYQLELAVVQISGGNLTSIYSQIGTSFLLVGSPMTNGIIRASDVSNSLVFSVDEGDLVFRTKGTSNTGGEIKFLNGGQQVGGHPASEFITAGNISCPAGDTTYIRTTDPLDVNGTYLAVGQFSFIPGGTQGMQVRVYLTSAVQSFVNSIYSYGSSAIFANVFGIFTGVTSISLAVQPFSNNQGVTASARTIRLVRIN